MLSVIEAKRQCQKNNIEIRGELKFDPYIGWFDEDKFYCNGYCVLCDLNIISDFCRGCEDSTDSLEFWDCKSTLHKTTTADTTCEHAYIKD